jgi:phosphatidylserine decarboxylase
VIKNNEAILGIIQIASRNVRRIITFVKEGQYLRRGERIGKIVFGSQVDVILPIDSKLLIQRKMRVYSGKTPIARTERSVSSKHPNKNKPFRQHL